MRMFGGMLWPWMWVGGDEVRLPHQRATFWEPARRTRAGSPAPDRTGRVTGVPRQCKRYR